MSEIIEVKLVNAEVTTLRLEPGDVVLVKADRALQYEQQRALSKALQSYFPKNKVVAHGSDFEFSVVKADQQGEDAPRYCPECGRTDFEVTCDGGLLDGGAPSGAACVCGWRGRGSETLAAPPMNAVIRRIDAVEQWIANQDSQNK